MLNRSRSVLGLSLLTALSMLIGQGCSSDDGMGTRYPVTGTVKYKGAPLAKGEITFSPATGGGQGASGAIENGSFKLSTLNPGDGVLPGEYTVSIDTRVADDEKIKAEADALFAKKGKGMEKLSMIPQEVTAKHRKAAKGSIPEKYLSGATSGLKAKVSPESLSFTFDLTD